MKKFLIAFVVFLIWSIFGLWLYSWLQPNTKSAQVETELNEKDQGKEVIEDSLEQKKFETDSLQKIKTLQDTIPSINKVPKIGLKATNESNDIIFIFSEGIIINKNSNEIKIPNSVIDYKYKINTYLIEHPEQEIHINSLYSPKESVVDPNYGIQRAESIYKQLLLTGVPKEKVVIKSVIKDIIFNENNDFNSGIYFTFKPLDYNRIELLKKTIPKARIVYPKFSDSGILVNNDLKELLNELKVYFNNNPNKKIDIIGHTDKIGNALDNYNIGLKYAKQVRWYLISKGGFDKSLLRASSKGESEPIDDNNKHSGRIANRRIEVIFN